MGKSDIEQILNEGNAVRFIPTGGSMSPLFASGRDFAVVAPLHGRRLRRNDIILYRRPSDQILVLHRIYKIRKEGIYTLGDNQTVFEGPLNIKTDVKGIMVQMTRKGKTFSMGNPLYRTASFIWLLMRPVRPFFMGIFNKIRLKKTNKTY